MAGHRFHPSILREYDVRGVVGETLDEADAYAIGRSFATMVWQVREGGADAASVVGGTAPWVEVATAAGGTLPPTPAIAPDGAGRLADQQRAPVRARSSGEAIQHRIGSKIGDQPLRGPYGGALHPRSQPDRDQGQGTRPGNDLVSSAGGTDARVTRARDTDTQETDAKGSGTGSPGGHTRNPSGDSPQASGSAAATASFAQSLTSPGPAPETAPLAFRASPSRSDAPRVAVGRDGRLSSPMLEAAVVRGLVDGGVDVVRVGLGPTPMLYYAEASAPDVEGGIQVTGSHNPGNHNGFKIVLGGLPVHGEAIVRLGLIAAAGDWSEGAGRVEVREVLSGYVARLLEGLTGIAPDKLEGLRIGWDAGNGAVGPALELLTSQLPGQHHLLFSEVDGNFPNHHPDPTVEENLADLQDLVAAKKLDFGVAFDGDGDRIGIVDSSGRPIWGDESVAIFAGDILARYPGVTVIADVKASQMVFERIAALGGKPIMAPSGHSLIKTVMKETGAFLGGETSAHVFFADDWYGFDDALYAAVRLMAATVRLQRTVTQMRDDLPATISTPELRFAVAEERKFEAVQEVHARLAAQGAWVIAIDGVRVVRPEGWWLLRASNTQAALTARAESSTHEGLAHLLAEIDTELALCGLSRAGA